MNTNFDNDNNGISRRIFIVGGGMFVLSATVLGQLWNLQVRQGGKYKLLSDKNRIRLTPIQPQRGRFLDRNGLPIAINSSNFKLSYFSENGKDGSRALEKLSKHINLNSKHIEKIKIDIKKTKNGKPIFVKDNLTIEEINILEKINEKEGFVIKNINKRSYIEQERFAHIVGYVRKKRTSDHINSTSISGVTGLEYRYDNILRGQMGFVKTEVNAVGDSVKILDKNESISGQDITLTIDRNLQENVYTMMKGKPGAACVLDIRNGDIMALCSSPSFDPNDFVNGFSEKKWRILNNNIHKPFLNKAINGEYPPGSTFKMMVALAGLESGLLDPKKKIICEGKTDFGDRTFHCWRDKGHKEVDLRKAIKVSCDTYFYKLAARLGIDRIALMAYRFGLGKNYNLISERESKGLIPDRRWRKNNLYNSRWGIGDTVVAGIGQGFVTATPLQLAVMIGSIANKGFNISPNLISSPAAKKNNHSKPLGLSFSNIDMIRNFLDIAVNERGSNGYKSRISDQDWLMGGKTGTSQVKEISEEERLGEVVTADKWEFRDHALFVGYAPTKKPRFAVSVILEHGGSGSRNAAPIGRDILLACRNLEGSGYRI
tara:strand:- start:687 stop:2489 length:1803 start_codon:yes stop_codon:yes gene_type:complete